MKRFRATATSVLLLAAMFSRPQQGLSSTLSADRAEAFIHALVFEPEQVESFVDPSELAFSKRLGIRYEGVEHKFLISYEIDPQVIGHIREARLEYAVQVKDLGDGYSQVVFTTPTNQYRRTFYFSGDYLVSPVLYHTSRWSTFDSRHFKFIVHDTTQFNSYCVGNLERFFERMAQVLALSDEDARTIESQKLCYVLCRDEADMESLTGHHSLGMFNLAYDCVITTYNAHYHELIHQLVNFKLRSLPLYTHPFLQEGLAVVLGGRGGKEPGPISNLGLFLQQSGMLDYASLLTKQGFYEVDESLSYPLSGLYNLFLIDQLGIDEYLKLYRRFSGTAEEVETVQITPDDLPPDSVWQRFAEEFAAHPLVDVEHFNKSAPLLYESPVAIIRSNDRGYYFSVQDTLLLLENSEYRSLFSARFKELFKNREYTGEKYAIVCDSNEISIYNLYTNNLIANLVAGFTFPPVTIPYRNGRFEFSVRKEVFDEELSSRR